VNFKKVWAVKVAAILKCFCKAGFTLSFNVNDDNVDDNVDDALPHTL